ncbi:MAG: hypothetical protein AABY40_03215 [Nanoarchaeota archaeon]
MDAKTDYEKIFGLIGGLRKQIEKAMPSVRRSIDSIIKDEITSSRIIEQLLDQLLDYNSLGLAENEFKRLNRYYAKIDPENALFYEREFKKWQDED